GAALGLGGDVGLPGARGRAGAPGRAGAAGAPGSDGLRGFPGDSVRFPTMKKTSYHLYLI
ncbi:unnamed protein product, partial [Rotaria magnacalcarata]